MTIYVGMDGSEGAAAAARWAVREGQLRQIPVTAVVAWDYLNQAASRGHEEFDPEYSEEDALGLLRAWLVSEVGSAAADTVGRLSVCDLTWRALTAVSVEADLLVVGARGTGGFLGLRIGSVSERVLEHASCPVAVIHVDTRQQGASVAERIVVGVDGSATSSRALAWALDEARARQAQVHLVSAWSVPIMVYPGAMEGANIFEGAATEVLHAAVRDADVHGLTHPIKSETVAGGAASALIDAANDATLLVVGSRGLSRARELVFGSVSRQVVHHAPCPVVVIQPDRRDTP
jgi:nucleotide-binding universal stress UspA family protein